MIVAITDGRANISLKRSTSPEAAAADAPRPSAQELKVPLSFLFLFCLVETLNPLELWDLTNVNFLLLILCTRSK